MCQKYKSPADIRSSARHSAFLQLPFDPWYPAAPPRPGFLSPQQHRPSCPIISSFTTPVGSCIHTTAPGWAQYGSTYQPIHYLESRQRQVPSEVSGNKMNGMEKNEGSMSLKGRIINEMLNTRLQKNLSYESFLKY